MSPTHEQKFAEKLIIMNKRLLGLMTRMHYIKRVMSTQHRPTFLSGGDKAYDPALKALLKKFPNVESKTNRSALQPLTNIKNDILQKLEVHYYTIIDVIEARDEVLELLGRINGAQIQLDININFDFTYYYLEVVANYFAMMMLLQRLEDRKAILCLYSFAHEMTHGSEPAFPRTAETLNSFESPFQRLHSDMQPYANLLKRALLSLNDIASKRYKSVSQEMLMLLDDLGGLPNTPPAEEVLCDLVSLDTMERWIVFGFLMIYTEFTTETCWNLWEKAMRHSFVVVLYRDEVIHIHAVVLEFFDSIRNYTKRCEDVREIYRYVSAKTCIEHRLRRRILRETLREMLLILSNEPGYLGPKALVVLVALCNARDEVLWLLRHSTNPPPKKIPGLGNVKVNQEDFRDDHLAELMFYMDRLANLFQQHSFVIQRFYAQMLHSYDLPALLSHLKSLSLPESEQMLFSEILEEIRRFDPNYSGQLKNIFKGPRLDWFRLQTYLSPSLGSFRLCEQRRFGGLMNALMLHTKMVDSQKKSLLEVSDLSVFCFYKDALLGFFENSLKKSPQHRFLMVYPLVCAHFIRTTHKMCPEEYQPIAQSSFLLSNTFCTELCGRVVKHVKDMCLFAKDLDAALLPRQAVSLMSVHRVTKKSKKSAANAAGTGSSNPSKKSSKQNAQAADSTPLLPGHESMRRFRDEDITPRDQTLMVIADIAWSISSVKEVVFTDRKIILSHIMQLQTERMFYDLVKETCGFNKAERKISQPSELLQAVRAFMNVLNNLEYILAIDTTKVFENVFKQTCLLVDPYEGEPTITNFYAQWYINNLLNTAFVDQVLYSPLLKSFVTSPLYPQCSIHPEEYADLNELRALVDLLGPLGMQLMFELLMEVVAREFKEIRQSVVTNSKVLEKLRVSFSNIKETRELLQELSDADTLFRGLKRIGLILAFRNLCSEAMRDVFEERIPFLVASVDELRHSRSFGDGDYPLSHENRFCDLPDICRLSAGFGLRTEIDILLCEFLRMTLSEYSQRAMAIDPYNTGEHSFACNLMVFIACALPRVMQWEHGQYRPELDAHDNNMHCLALATNSLLTSLFFYSKKGDLSERMKEFVALCSLHMLRHGATAFNSTSGSGSSGASGNNTDSNMFDVTHSDFSEWSSNGSQSNAAFLIAGAIMGSGASNASSSAMTLLSPQQRQQLNSLYLMLYQVISASPYVTSDPLESCFPYALVRSAHHNVYCGTVLRKNVAASSTAGPSSTSASAK